MLRLNIRRAELAGFITGKEDNASGFFRITFKHKALPPELPEKALLAKPADSGQACNHNATISRENLSILLLIQLPRIPHLPFYHSGMCIPKSQSPLRATPEWHPAQSLPPFHSAISARDGNVAQMPGCGSPSKR